MADDPQGTADRYSAPMPCVDPAARWAAGQIVNNPAAYFAAERKRYRRSAAEMLGYRPGGRDVDDE